LQKGKKKKSYLNLNGSFGRLRAFKASTNNLQIIRIFPKYMTTKHGRSRPRSAIATAIATVATKSRPSLPLRDRHRHRRDLIAT
jgi:hypothetical protein